MQVVINKCHGSYGLSKAAYEYLNIEWNGWGGKFEDDRSNPDLIKVVKALGDKANGDYTELKIVKVPNDVDWCIEEYDGLEWIAEVHRTWE